MKMVGNYAGKRASELKAPAAKSSTVSDHMTRKLVTFRPEQSIEEVMHTLVKKNISGGPVVNERDELVGMISEGDCLKQVVKGKYHNLPDAKSTVAEHMITDVITIDPDKDIFDAAHQFLDKRIRRFPVLRDGKLVGQISQKDIMKAVMQLKPTTW